MHMPGHGENRKAIKNLARKLGDVTLRGGSAVGNKITTIFDDVFTPTTRIVEFEGTTHQHKRDASHAEQTKVAQKGTRHFQGIFAKPVKHEISFMAPTYPKNEADNALIDEALERNFVFDTLPKEKRKVLIDAFEPIMVKAGTTIINQGDTGDYFYVLGVGEIECQIDGNVVGHVEKGGSFGELALLYDAPRAATCIAEGQCGLFRLDQGTFKRILAQQIQESHNEVIQILKGVLYFQDLEDKYLEKIASNLKMQSYTDGEVIVSRTLGTPKRFYIIKEGKIDITSIQADNKSSRDMKSDLKGAGPGFFFGEYAVTEGKYAFETATARGHVVCLQLERDDFIKAVGNDVGQLIQKGADMKRFVSYFVCIDLLCPPLSYFTPPNVRNFLFRHTSLSETRKLKSKTTTNSPRLPMQ
jgi:cAMP-dependent protein kinase regulator